MKRAIKMLALVLIVSSITALFTACSGDTIPNGRYVPLDSTVAMTTIQAIVIDGNNFTMVQPLIGTGITLKYTYKNGTITFTDGTTGVSAACEYKDGSLWYAGFEFKKS